MTLGISPWRLGLAALLLAIAVVSVIGQLQPGGWATLFGTINPDWLPMIFNLAVLGTFVVVATGLAPERELATTALVGLVFYGVLGLFLRLMVAAALNQPINWSPAWLVEQAIVWPSFLLSFFMPLL
ncbi:MAG TPA: hypothetical protein VHL09_03285 [Dehalococcoidia bacterium]|nr:hypothetical protein [Dehalococcoidia bacterium]